MEWHSFLINVLWNAEPLGLAGSKDLITEWSVIFFSLISSQCYKSGCNFFFFFGSRPVKHFQGNGQLLNSTHKPVNRSLLFFVSFHRFPSNCFNTLHLKAKVKIENLWCTCGKFYFGKSGMLFWNVTGSAFLFCSYWWRIILVLSLVQTPVFGKCECQKPGYEVTGPFISCADT